MNKISKYLHVTLEIIWFAAALFCIYIAIKEGIAQHYRQTAFFLMFTLVALYFYFTRRKQRLK
jgi:hypothetical protein